MAEKLDKKAERDAEREEELNKLFEEAKEENSKAPDERVLVDLENRPKGRGRRLSDEDKNLIVRLYNKGANKSEIAKLMKSSPITIKNVLDERMPENQSKDQS